MSTIIFASFFAALLGFGISLCIATDSGYTKGESVRFICGAILTGLAAGALIGGATISAG